MGTGVERASAIWRLESEVRHLGVIRFAPAQGSDNTNSPGVFSGHRQPSLVSRSSPDRQYEGFQTVEMLSAFLTHEQMFFRTLDCCFFQPSEIIAFKCVAAQMRQCHFSPRPGNLLGEFYFTRYG